ncbi:hypothetical protein GCM10023175_04170 [Pseudonocardia xishanensis]|uniref:Uncharacterized protein n=1 Tax=Pseudonocardia xishanensis TaxID=630995 RepID=A0ABP8REY9_9PSEU
MHQRGENETGEESADLVAENGITPQDRFEIPLIPGVLGGAGGSEVGSGEPGQGDEPSWPVERLLI